MEKNVKKLLKDLYILYSTHINKNFTKPEDIWWNNLKQKNKKIIYNKHR